MARHAWHGRRVPLPVRPIRRHRRMTTWQRRSVAWALWLVVRLK
jgi:hypothetical protein